jgi:hypothetical protein
LPERPVTFIGEETLKLILDRMAKGVVSFHFKVPICDLLENGKIYDIDSCRDYIYGQKH